MKTLTHKKGSFIYLAIALMVMLGFAFSIAIQPAFAQAQDPTATATTAAGDATNTPVATLAAPETTGTPTALIPVTGADLDDPAQPSAVGTVLRVAVGLLGLTLLVLGIRSFRLKER